MEGFVNKFLITYLDVKNIVKVTAINIGIYLKPSLIFPFAIRPIINEPITELIIRVIIAYLITKSTDIDTLVMAKGRLADICVVGISTLPKVTVIISTK